VVILPVFRFSDTGFPNLIPVVFLDPLNRSGREVMSASCAGIMLPHFGRQLPQDGSNRGCVTSGFREAGSAGMPQAVEAQPRLNFTGTL